MASPVINGLAGRIASVEADLMLENLSDIFVKLDEITKGKMDSDYLGWLGDRIRWTEEKMDRIRAAQKQVAAGEFRPALFFIMERFYSFEEKASSRIISDDLQKIGEDYKERTVYYRRAIEYGKIAHELLDLMATQ